MADSSGMSSPTYRRENGPWSRKSVIIKKEAVPIWHIGRKGRGKGRGREVSRTGNVADDKYIHSIKNKEITECVISILIFDFLMLAPVLLGYRSRTPNASHL
jgi:hypothetical protein